MAWREQLANREWRGKCGGGGRDPVSRMRCLSEKEESASLTQVQGNMKKP